MTNIQISEQVSANVRNSKNGDFYVIEFCFNGEPICADFILKSDSIYISFYKAIESIGSELANNFMRGIIKQRAMINSLKLLAKIREDLCAEDKLFTFISDYL